MRLARYISDLLYRYECVIVPNFGGFVTREIAARVNHYTHTFYPPGKSVSFNDQLQHNDGLLTNYIAQVEDISYKEALHLVDREVAGWLDTLANSALELAQLGTLTCDDEQRLLFEPDNTTNYLTASFGLSPYVSPAIKRIAHQEKLRKLEPVLSPSSSEPARKTPAFIKYAATAAVIFSLVYVGSNQWQQTSYNNLVAAASQQQKVLEKKIQEATFVIENPLPAITLNLADQQRAYHLVAGAYREPANAARKLEQLFDKGYTEARILGTNEWNLTQVAFESFPTRKEALKKLHHIKKNEDPYAWLLVKKF